MQASLSRMLHADEHENEDGMDHHPTVTEQLRVAGRGCAHETSVQLNAGRLYTARCNRRCVLHCVAVFLRWPSVVENYVNSKM